MSINTALLLVLADASIQATAKQYGTDLVGSSDSISLKIAAEFAKRKDDAETAAVKEICNLYEVKDANILLLSQQKEVLQQQMNELDNAAAEISNAAAYGSATRNFLPLSTITKQPIPVGAKKELLVVPKGWTVPVAAPAAPAAPAAAS